MFRLIKLEPLLEHCEIKFVDGDKVSPTPKYAMFCAARGSPAGDVNWVEEDDDFTFQKCCDFKYENIHGAEESAFRKLVDAGRCAKTQGCDYMWVDYCCVGPEDLVENVGSRYQWYAKAKICLVFLPDGQMGSADTDALYVNQYGCPCKWFMQTWTVQALLASKKLIFYNREYQVINTFQKRKPSGHPFNPFELEVSQVTDIPLDALMGWVPLHEYSVAARLSWATGLFGEIEEDMAYSLVVIFGINMMPNYGEGWQSAFHRLVAAIMGSTSDLSILAWHDQIGDPSNSSLGALPREPGWNACYSNIASVPSPYPVYMTTEWICVTHLIYPMGERYFMCLGYNGELAMSVGIYLRRLSDNTFQREGRELRSVDIGETTPLLFTFYIQV
ncbi:hypothetical protein F4803DRAFT_569082 [Xylaria telfairii]|nr:hypothetical protein F4803DRAFT_569082 [Xylaria telfairii]